MPRKPTIHAPAFVLLAAVAAAVLLAGCMSLAPWQKSAADSPSSTRRDWAAGRAVAEAGNGGQTVDTIAGQMARAAEADRQIDQAFDLVVQQRYDEARVRLAELAHRFRRAEDDEHAARAMLWLAFCYEKTSKKNQAELFYQRILVRYGETSAAQAARVRLEALDLPGDRARAQTPPAE